MTDQNPDHDNPASTSSASVSSLVQQNGNQASQASTEGRGHHGSTKTEQDGGNPGSTMHTTVGASVRSKPAPVELDDFGLPIRRKEPRRTVSEAPHTAMYKKTVNVSGVGVDTPLPQRVLSHSALPVRASSVPVEGAEVVEEPGNRAETIANLKEPDRETRPSEGNVETPEPKGLEDPPKYEKASHKRNSTAGNIASEWSHQHLTEKPDTHDEEDDGGWKSMTAVGPLDFYDDCGRLVARAAKEEEEEANHGGYGAAGKGYTRVQDDDARSVTSLDEETSYLFNEPQTNGIGVEEELRDPLAQLQATKDLLTEGQRIAYVGVTRLAIFQMVKDLESIKPTKSTKKLYAQALDSMTKWGQQIMLKLYAHMDIDSAEQVMIEQLAEHGVHPGDLVPPLMKNARVKNPAAEQPNGSAPLDSTGATTGKDRSQSFDSLGSLSSRSSSPPPPYGDDTRSDLPSTPTPSQLPTSAKLEIDLRWTVLCDLFLLLISTSTYDSRSRHLLERIGNTMDVSWLQICRFEKRVTDALEMQEEEARETWDESENMEKRRKMALRRRYMVMGLATVGGGLVIGLSAGLLAPLIGAGLAAGFTTIGVSGTGAFLGGVGGTALITSGATLTGSTIGIRASNRRTGAVKTFEYRPLHNNKRVNLIVTISGWMTGGVDDVRLPYSTIDPIMGDIYSVLWEPDMLKSMGETINILATEALTQGLQQVLGSTVLVALMASLQLPIVLSKLSYLIDNPWTVSLARANLAGLILADSLAERNLGNRPITLVGFSLGSRVIFSCLKELAKKGAFGIVQNVYMFGSPIVANNEEYLKARSIVPGRFVNGYASNDWILGYLFRATGGGIMRVAGLAPVEVPGIENIDVTHLVNGHMAYRAEMPRLMREVGWEVESDEFAELEDPDPDNHRERQRELIREINEARKEAEQIPEKKKFGFFKRGKLAEKKGWETYDVNDGSHSPSDSMDGSADPGGNVLFDIDAIRAELASEQIQVKQLESTLPPMKLDLSSVPPKNAPSDTASEISINPKKPVIFDRGPQPASVVTSLTSQSHSSFKVESTASRDRSPGTTTIFNRSSTWAEPYREPEMQMTFDTSYDTPARSSTDVTKSSSVTSPVTEGRGRSPLGMNLTHNAWADDGHNAEDEIQLSFE